MALFKIIKGDESTLNQVPKTEGYAYFCTNTGAFFVDIDDQHRVQVTARQLVDYQNNTLTAKSFSDVPTQTVVNSAINNAKTKVVSINFPRARWSEPEDIAETIFKYQHSSLNTLRCTIPPLIICDSTNTTTNKTLYNNIVSISIDPASGNVNGAITITLNSSSVVKDQDNDLKLIVLDFG